MSGPAAPCRGAVLVGGRSSRMGRDKALVAVDGVPMAQRVATALRSAGCVDVVAVGPAHSAAGLDVLPDRYPHEGPLGAILTALVASAPAEVLVAACDLPWLDLASVSALLAAGRAHPGADVVVGRTDRVEPLCALWRPTAIASVRQSFDDGERAVHRAMRALRCTEVVLDADALRNVNSPGDLPE